MSECFKYIYYKNDQLKSSDHFNDSDLQKGITLYEVIRIISGKPLFIEDHFLRLTNSALKVDLPIWYSFEKIKEYIKILIEKNDTTEGNIKLVFNVNNQTRNFYAYFVKHRYPSDLQYKNGVRSIVIPAERPNPNAKIYNHSLRSKTNNLIHEAEIFEVLLLNSLGNITEGSRSNLFFIRNGSLFTAPDNEVLNGIVRNKIIEIATEQKIPLVMQSISYADLPKFEAAFITGTSPMVLPLKRINSLKYSVSHPLIKTISEFYREKTTMYLAKHQ